MIDFNTSQLTWIVIGACSIGGTGYLSMDSTIKDVATKVEVMNVKTQENERRLIELKDQLSRIEDKLDNRK
jgi:hypothetical protein